MAISKVIVNGVVKVDMTGDTATSATIISPETAHIADGTQATGSYVAPSSVAQATPTISVDTSTGLITASSTQAAGLVSAGTTTATEQLTVKTSADMSAVGDTVTAPAGFYTSAQSKSVASGSATTPATTITANPSISVSNSGLITATASATKSVTPTVSAGYVSSGTAGTITVSGSNTSQLTTQAGSTIAPTESVQTAVASGTYTTGTVKIGAISSTYVGSGITQRDSTDLSASGATVSVPSGYYASNASANVASGSVTAPATISGSSATVSTGTNTLTLSKTVSVTPSVTTAGYVSSGTAGNSSVSLTASVTTQGAQTIHPSTTDQTIASGKYLTGTQTFAAVTTTNLTAANIVSGVTVKVGDASDDDCVASVTGTASGGGSNYTLLATKDFTVNTTSTSAGSVGTVSVGSDALTTAKVIYVKIRDKAGPRAGYFLGSDCYFYNATLANGSYGSALTTMGRLIHRYTSASQYAVYVGATTTGYGVYGYSVSTGGAINIYRRYSSSYSLTINSVYNVEVYALDYAPNTGNPYNYTFTPDVHGTGTLSNMIEDGNFANTTWWGAYNVAYSVSSNTGDVYANGASKAYPQLTRDYMLVVPNHVYYIRADMKYDWSDPTPPPHPGEISFHTTDWATFLNVQYDASNAGTWQTLSTLGTYSTTIGNFNLALPYDTDTTYGYQNLHVYFKNVMFVDLTEGYDYGNEPTKAWCDANLPYFQGTYTIPT